MPLPRRTLPCAGDWKTAAWLIATTTALPTLLSLPWAVAQLTWAGGMACLTAAALSWLYCCSLLVELHHHPVPEQRLSRYRDMTHAILGGWVRLMGGCRQGGGGMRRAAAPGPAAEGPLAPAPPARRPPSAPLPLARAGPRWRHGPALFAGLQYAVAVGTVIALIILSGQILQFICQQYSPGACRAACTARRALVSARQRGASGPAAPAAAQACRWPLPPHAPQAASAL